MSEPILNQPQPAQQQNPQSTTPQNNFVYGDLSTIMHPLKIPPSIPISINSFSSQTTSDLNDKHTKIDNVNGSTDNNNDEGNIDSPTAMELPVVNKKLSISSVSDSGNESIVDEESSFSSFSSNEKLILDYFAQDQSKTVKLARRKSSDGSLRSYDSTDDESTLSESSFPPSPSEDDDHHTPRPTKNENVFDYESFCAAIDKKLMNGINNSQGYFDKTESDFHENHDSSDGDYEDEDEDEDYHKRDCDKSQQRNPNLIRSTSLKTGKTPPDTPGRKKIVRFADALGLDLASIRHIHCDVPYVPPLDAFKSLQLDADDRDWLVRSRSNIENQECSDVPVPYTDANAIPKLNATLRILFCQPSSDPLKFLERVRSNRVCLENCLLDGPSGSGQVFKITCLVRVLNICFQKKVFLRYTTNEWLTWNEVPGSYVNNSNDGFSDKFTIIFDVAINSNGHQTMMPGQRLLFAIRYLTDDESQENWDNNMGTNYALMYEPC